MIPLRQTCLGFTATKSLTIVKNGLSYEGSTSGQGKSTTQTIRLPPYVATGESFVFRLPDELLLSIVELAICGPGSRSQAECEECTPRDNDCVRVLSRVCQRLRRIAQPLLFRTFRLEYPIKMVPPSITAVKLRRTLTENAEFRKHCRSLHMYIPDYSRAKGSTNYSVAMDFAYWLTRTRCISIHGGFDNKGQEENTHTWDLIRRFVARCEDIEHVRLSREGWGLYLVPILKWVNFPKLKKLDIHGISEWKDGKVGLELEKHRTASFTSLRLSDYEERPEATCLLLQWPAALTHFEFGSFYNNPHIMDYPMFESWLLIHKETLKHIDIGYLSNRGSSRLFNATLFPNLEFLQLSRWQMHLPVEFHADDANVLGPKLKVFSWDFNIYDQHNESWTDFGEPEASWIRELAERAIARKAALKTIKIQFSPDHWGTKETMGYPWDRMDNVRDQVLRPNGIDLVYNEPELSKEAWLEHIKVEEAWTAENEILESVHDMVQNEQPGSAEEETEVAEPVMQTENHGEDIRKYLVSRSGA